MLDAGQHLLTPLTLTGRGLERVAGCDSGPPNSGDSRPSIRTYRKLAMAFSGRMNSDRAEASCLSG